MNARVMQVLKKRLPSLLLGGALGLGGGWLLRGSVHSAPTTTANVATVSAAATPAGQSPPYASPSSLNAAAANEAAEVQTFLRLACAADAAAAVELPRLLLAVQKSPGVLPMLAAHWAQRDAAHMFAALSRNPAARVLAADSTVREALFDHWLKADRDAALAALGDAQALPDIATIRSAAVGELLYKEPRRALTLINDWKLNLHYKDMGGITAWAKREPAAAAAAAADAAARMSLPMVADHLIIEIARVWKDTDPAAAIQWAVNHARRFPGSQAPATVVHIVSMEWDGYDPAPARAAAGAITDPALRVHLGLPLLPPADSEMALPAQ
jgi:hypothetical protein